MDLWEVTGGVRHEKCRALTKTVVRLGTDSEVRSRWEVTHDGENLGRGLIHDGDPLTCSQTLRWLYRGETKPMEKIDLLAWTCSEGDFTSKIQLELQPCPLHTITMPDINYLSSVSWGYIKVRPALHRGADGGTLTSSAALFSFSYSSCEDPFQ